MLQNEDGVWVRGNDTAFACCSPFAGLVVTLVWHGNFVLLGYALQLYRQRLYATVDISTSDALGGNILIPPLSAAVSNCVFGVLFQEELT